MSENNGRDENPPSLDEQTNTINWRGKSLTAPEAQDSVGKNFEKYWLRWQAMTAGKIPISFNWAAAVFGPAWMGLRKMHLYAASFVLGFSLIFIITFSASYYLTGISNASRLWGVIVSIILLCVISGFWGNALYLRQTIDHVARLQKSSNNQETKNRKGTSWFYGLIWGGILVLSLIASLFFTDAIRSTLKGPKFFISNNQYCPEIKQVIEQAGSEFAAYKGQKIMEIQDVNLDYFWSKFSLSKFSKCFVVETKTSKSSLAYYTCASNRLRNISTPSNAKKLSEITGRCLNLEYMDFSDPKNRTKETQWAYDLGFVLNKNSFESYGLIIDDRTTLYISSDHAGIGKGGEKMDVIKLQIVGPHRFNK